MREIMDILRGYALQISDAYHQFLQDVGIMVTISIGLTTLIGIFIRKISTDKKTILERGKDIASNIIEIKDIKEEIQDINDALVQIKAKLEERGEIIHHLEDETIKAIADVRESLARLEGEVKTLRSLREKDS